MTRGAETTLPVLMYHGVPATAPAVADDLKVPLDVLDAQLAALVADGWELLGLTEALAADASRRVVGVTFDDGYLDFLGAVEVLRRHGARASLYVPVARVGARGLAGEDYLDWSQLAELAAGGDVEIGSHSMTHHPLDVLRDDELAVELRDSRRELSNRLGVPVVSMCYPHGYAGRRVCAQTKAAGYDNACVVGRRIAVRGGDRFSVPRLQVRPGDDAFGIRHLVVAGEPGLAPRIKPVAQPVWRGVRQVSRRLGVELT